MAQESSLDDRALFDKSLERLLKLHLEERELMHQLRHAEHEACVERKLQEAMEAERLGVLLAHGPSAAGREMLGRIQEAARANADIAGKMLEQSKGKIDFIRKMSSTSYGKDGQMKPPSLQGGLFTSKT